MATDSEKRLLKQFLDGLDTNKLCEIVRSVYHGGGVRVNSREDAELLLLTQPAARTFSSKKVPITSLLKFLISKGLVPIPNMTKADLCLAFQTLVENQPDYTKPPAQPAQPIQMQPIQSMQMQPIQSMQLPVANNVLTLPQNNNTMHYQSYQATMQQHMPMPVPATTALVLDKKSRKDRDNELLEEFIEMFAKHL